MSYSDFNTVLESVDITKVEFVNSPDSNIPWVRLYVTYVIDGNGYSDVWQYQLPVNSFDELNKMVVPADSAVSAPAPAEISLQESTPIFHSAVAATDEARVLASENEMLKRLLAFYLAR
jgi:hypothetical protein